MTIRDHIASVFAFKVAPTTFVALIVYAAIYVSVLFTDDLPYVPRPNKQGALNLTSAFQDLHWIAAAPHPYNSHQNDVVRSYILKRVQANANSFGNVQVDDDTHSNATWAQTGLLTYFEGNNVLVKIEGRKPDLDAVLFSAHFDSVSTAPGATDDGMGVATLLQLVDYFAKHQPKRTAIFNINNGEEDGLHGAHVFLEHPWFKLAKDFINLEGAGAGGRPLLLRTTSTRLARAFSNANHPFGNVISADAFARGVVKSGTDYTVYTDASMRGLDFTFYKPRSKYHTKEDSIPSLGGNAPLWNMLESTFLTGKALVDDESSDDKAAPVYFDLLGEALVVFSLKAYFIFNIILLSVGPILVAGLVFAAYRAQKLYWTGIGWGRLPIAFVVSAGLTLGLGLLYNRFNPFIVYSSPASVFISCIAASYIGMQLTFQAFSSFRPIPQQKSLILLEIYIFWWIMLVIDTFIINKVHVGGLYFVTFFHAATLAALLIGLLEHLSLSPGRAAFQLRRQGMKLWIRKNQNGEVITKKDIDEDNVIALWFIQFLLAVPFPVILITQVAVMLLNALGQTLADGSKPLTVYLAVSLVALFSIIPIAPFSHKLHRSVAALMMLVFLITALHNLFAFPFSNDAPLKVFFQQTIDLDTGRNSVSLTGAKPWIDRDIISEMPSSWKRDLSCSPDPLRAGLPACVWTGLPPAVAAGPKNDWLSYNATLKGPGSGVITVHGSDTRNCRIYVNTPVTNVHVRGGDDRIQGLYPMPREGVREIRLWSREWNRTFEVRLGWEGSAGLSGRVACDWAEGGLPAFDEVLAFLPRWARVTKRTDGLLEASKRFSL